MVRAIFHVDQNTFVFDFFSILRMRFYLSANDSWFILVLSSIFSFLF